MRMGLVFRVVIPIVGILSSGAFLGCKPAKQVDGNSISAAEEIAAVSKQVNAEKRYRLSEEDMSALAANGLLNEKAKLALDTFSNK